MPWTRSILLLRRPLEAIRLLHAKMSERIDVHSELYFPAMILFRALITFNIILLIFLALFLGVGDGEMDSGTKLIFGPLVGALVAALTAALYKLVCGDYGSARFVTAMSTTCSVGAAIGLTGGFPNSVASPIAVLVPIVFFILYGIRTGGLATILVPLCIVLQWMITTFWGVNLPDFQSKSNPAMNVALVQGVTYTMVVLALVAYEQANRRLRAQRDAERERLARLAHHDMLTGLPNSRYFQQRLAEACAGIDRNGGQLTVLYLDLNGFKDVNDQFGHRIGDLILCTIASRIRHSIRLDEICARLGGDEFAILVGHVRSASQVARLIERIHALMSEPIDIEGSRHRITASIGKVLYPGDVAEQHLILDHADRAMYEAKRLASVSPRRSAAS